MELDTDILIIGAGMSGLGFAVQLVRQYGHRNFEIIERSNQVGGTWLANSYPGNLKTAETYDRRYKILVSAVGILSQPNPCDIPGVSSFQGRIFHTADWDHSFDWKNKEIVVVGNGCSATQVVPVISQGDGAVKKVTQFARQAQWVFERPNPKYSSLFKWTMKWVPFAMRSYRLMQNYYCEWDFQSFPTESGASIRKMYADYQGAYIRRMSPEKYHEFLVPNIEVGCRRRVMDTDFLECLHRNNVELVYKDPIEKIVENGVRTKSGRFVKADAIVLANGFQILKPLLSINLHGEEGVSVADHWDKVSDGAASAYFGTCLSGFPNFFIMMGPNTASGHGSVTYITECQIEFTLRVIKPILKALNAQRSILPVIRQKTDVVKVKPEAEQVDIDTIQERLKSLVWSSGCTSWALDPKTGRNTTMYPDFQFKYWLRSMFIPWRDFELSTSKPVAAALSLKTPGASSWLVASISVTITAYFAYQRLPLQR
ncbi:hypothetical protein GQX73_g8072 [Xylaria multiplex]|uniref:Uncharacterized protein n=1 Tax=Xylaria multiplex TaxID=323545 RepID=A0A7C8MLN8_9PEZI|nr:hypothetical protein GQX73_g8072 [Xylaria multiplex]